jgi:ATP-dependent DNA helicase RecG
VLDDPITAVRGIGPKKAQLLAHEAGIETIEDLLYYVPRRYVDRSSFKLIKDCFVNDTVSVSGAIIGVAVAGRRRKYLEVEIDDGTDTLTGVFFAGIRYFAKIFKPGEHVIFSGKVNFYRKKQIVHPDFDFLDESSSVQSINTGRIVPLYRSTEPLKSSGFDSRGFRRAVRSALDSHLSCVKETIDAEILARHSLVGIREALYAVHFPDSIEQAGAARRRLAFNEIFFHQYYLSLARRYVRETGRKRRFTADDTQYRRFLSSLPFTLTKDQASAIEEIRKDIESEYPMNRLLQGDVGSGKTIVAMAAVLLSCGRKRQSAFMAPTEILARQHFAYFDRIAGSCMRMILLTGSTPRPEKERAYESIAAGAYDLVIGTHALIQEEVRFNNLGLIIIDEQHRFGVAQRSALAGKGEDADLLVMSATPIPRSLSLTVYGDLSVTSIRTLPSNRIPVKTMAFPESRLDGVYRSMEKYLSQGKQAYYVLPLIEDSDKVDLKSAVQAYEELKTKVFPGRRVELVHGRMKQDDRDSVMERFYAGAIDILVCTTVIEVGIDVPNAAVMVVEHAERFGLAQLHQLRGRVGRGTDQSFCILISPDDISDESRARIQTLVSTNDVFTIAEEDLKQRGAGELIGTKQHGHGAAFEFADLSADMDLVLYGREVAERLVGEIRDVPATWERFSNRKYAPLLDGIRNKKLLTMLS